MPTLASRAVVLPIVLAVASASGQATFKALGFLPGNEHGHTSEATALSSDGSVVVGFSTSAFEREPFRWTKVYGLEGLGFFSVGRAVSGDGKVIVGDDFLDSFAWSDPNDGGQGKVDLGDLPGGFVGTVAFGISADGKTAVGQSSSLKGFEAFRWTKAGGIIGLGDIAGGDFESCALGASGDGSVIVGYGTDGMSDFEAFIWTNPDQGGQGMVGLGDLPGGGHVSTAQGVSADGKTVVGHAASANGKEAFRWTKAKGMIGLGDLPGGTFESVAMAASADGSVIVGEGRVASGREAFVWTQDTGMIKLQDILKANGINLAGWTLLRANALSADGGTVAGLGDHNGLLEAFVASIPVGGGDGCYADFTGDGVLDLFDFLAFVNLFNAADPLADCDGNGGLDLFDFLCFTNAFNTGCV